MERKIRVLFLPRWYPSRFDPMPGLFIQRQAEAITPFCEVAVIYLHPLPGARSGHDVDFKVEHEVRVLRVYYHAGTRLPGLPGKLLVFYRYYKAYMKAIQSIREFSPDLVHAHILTRTGWIGSKLATKWRIPLVVSEHWSRYFPENNTYKGWLRKFITRRVVKKASALIVVSRRLQDAMEKCGLHHTNYRVIPNVVDLPLQRIQARKESPDKTVMVHISCFEDKSKNISGFLRSIKELYAARQDFTCLMVGEGPDLKNMKDYAAGLGLPDHVVKFTGLKTGADFVETLTSADFTVLSSRYETFGTVLIESLACGVPVLATNTGIAAEVIDKTNGLLVPSGDDHAMTMALSQMIDHRREYEGDRIRQSLPAVFTSAAVGNQIVSLYRSILGTS